MKSTNIRYLPAVDHLRGFAALLIVFYHALQLIRHQLVFKGGAFSHGEWLQTNNPLLSLVVEGHTSLGFFMVLSGFIFTFGTLDRPISYWRFISNRFLRIYPLYVFTVVIAAYSTPQGYSFLALLSSLLFQANLPGAFANYTFTGVAWAISVEFQFYLIFPFIVEFTRRYGVRYLFGLMAVAWMFRLFGVMGGTASSRDLSYWTIVGRLDQFIVGILMGVIYVRRPRMVRQLRFLLPVALGLTLTIVLLFHRAGGFPGASATVWYFWPTVEAVSWAFFALCYLGASEWIPAIPSRVLSYVGELSFSIYLNHFVVITLVCNRGLVFRLLADSTGSAILFTVLIILPAVLIVSTLTYFVIERPFLMMRKSYLAGTSREQPSPALSAVVPP